MVDTLLLGGKIAFGLMGLAAGFRLHRMARSGEGFGIHSLAAACVFVGGIGLAATALGPALADTSWALALVLTIGGDMLERLALIGLCVFVWKVFRPSSRWGSGLTVGLGLGLFASMGWEMAFQIWLPYDALLPSAWGTQVAFALPFAWSAAETGAEWRRSRRKLALGLISRIAVERFGLWSLACIGFVTICMLAIAVPIAADAGHTVLAQVLTALRAGLYYAVAVAIWLGIFTPSFYARRFSTDAQ